MKFNLEKLLLVSLIICAINYTNSQELHVASGGSIYISPGDALHVNNYLTINAAGSLTIDSDATSSGSIVVFRQTIGNITYKRHIPDTDWHLVSAPVTNQNIPSFVTDPINNVTTNPANGNFAVGYYKNTNNAGQKWTYYNASPSAPNQETLTDFASGQGYSTKRTTEGEFIFTGTVLNSDVDATFTASSASDLWFCIGNPYPSFTAANKSTPAGFNLLEQNLSRLDPNFAGLYFWNGSDYEVINSTSPTVYLSPGQAFMVKARTVNQSTSFFRFFKSLQTHQTGANTFFRSIDTTPSIIVKLSNGDIEKSTELKYFDNVTNGLDIGYDAGRYRENTPNFSLDTHLVADSKGIDFMLQCLPKDTYETQVIPLSVRAQANSTIHFKANAKNLPQNVDVYIEDREKNIFQKIDETPYKVTITTVQNGIGRFYLHTSSKTLKIEDTVAKENLAIYKTDDTTLRIVGLEVLNKATLKMYSVNGQKVMTKEFTTNGVQDILLPASLSTGVYIVQLTSENNNLSKKIIIE
ncbi:T9SS type A sorting domain-containing protein [Tenacibaculum agarivorans]|uniref:T9SS type A sorting domain-containing protein n=1 Tax=Tenacibaculum agarivorans TaxID=1908389 RepID=UPI00094BC0E8|nr:T9SS type A sorting domain-containing protein [Tenacibaculum agarivorans]